MVEEIIFKESTAEKKDYTFGWRLGAAFVGLMLIVLSPILYVLTVMYVMYLTASIMFMKNSSIEKVFNKK
jgi:hypothetical protein